MSGVVPREPSVTLAGLLVFAVWVVMLADGVLVAVALGRWLGWW